MTFVCFIFSILCFQIFAFDKNPHLNTAQPGEDYHQWFTGPILTPSPTTLPPGHPGLELELIVSKTYGFYDSDWKLIHT
ncbi:MAG: hypothetical protein KBA81_04130, partial [Rhabdochlamydiaceae bacterium]|nr:hypothetical protein [Rhabdochlamydiaceae bacterium]